MTIDLISETTVSRRALDDLLKKESPSYEQIVLELSKLKRYEYDRVRKDKAESLNVQLSTLDADVRDARQGSKKEDSLFSDIEPYPKEVVPSELLDDVTDTIRRFIVLEKPQAQLAALWVASCWFLDQIETAPIALINAPEKACGKTQLLTVLSRISPRAIQASGITPSALFRVIEAHQPTLFVDEIETVLKDNEALRGLINAGHTRSSATVVRCVGDDHEPKLFNAFGMKAIAGINAIKLASTVTDRSIIFELRRKRTDEKVERLRQAEPGLFSSISSKFARFHEDYRERLKKDINLPEELSDREQDNFEPLFAIADLAGGHWTESVKNAALILSSAGSNELSTGSELLENIQEIFERKRIDKIHMPDLVEALCEDQENRWLTYNRGGKPIAPRQISKRLSEYDIKLKSIRIGHSIKRGYERSQFEDVFSRYLALPPDIPLQSYKLIEANASNGSSVTNSNNVTVIETESATRKPLPVVSCNNVTENSEVAREETKSSNLRI
jgi:putative DNA primase/helicase